MFYSKQEKEKYYIWSDKIKWKFWPFIWIYCKNKYLWDYYIDNKQFYLLEKKYPAYKYSFWFLKNKLFIINKKWIEIILDI